MADSDEAGGSATEWRIESRWYRRSPGVGWLLGLLLIPLLFGWLSFGALKPHVIVTAPEAGVTTPSTPGGASEVASAPSLNFSPLSILRNGDDFTLTGLLPDLRMKERLLGALTAALGADVNLIDKLDVAAGATTPDFDGFPGLFTAAADIPDFRFVVQGDGLTLTGTAPSDEAKAAVGAAAKAGWPSLRISNNIAVQGQTPSCGDLQTTIDAGLAAPVKFQTGSDQLSVDGQQQLSAIIPALKGCPQVKLTVVGHTDNTGNDAINIPLSDGRARAVAAYLVAQGIPADAVASRGAGSAEPVASNDTDAGRAQNRRTEITVN